MFDVDEFVRDVAAVAPDPDARRAAEAILARALAAPADVADAIAPPAGGITLLHHAPDLTIINVAWAPRMELMPHDHRMWALIGIYAGAEDNRFYRRADDGLTESGDRRIEAGEVCALGTSTIHSVRNPTDRLTGAIHIYGGDFVNQPRSQWGPGDLVERVFDMDEVNRQFADANRAAGYQMPR